MAYSDDLRQKIIDAVKIKKIKYSEIQEIFGVSYTFIYNLEKRYDETGKVSKKPHGGGMPAKFTGKDLIKLKKFVEKNPDATLQEMLDHSGKNASIMAVSRALDRLGFIRKKNRYGQWSKTEKT